MLLSGQKRISDVLPRPHNIRERRPSLYIYFVVNYFIVIIKLCFATHMFCTAGCLSYGTAGQNTCSSQPFCQHSIIAIVIRL